jgi:hypothetical protein
MGRNHRDAVSGAAEENCTIFNHREQFRPAGGIAAAVGFGASSILT